MSPPRSLPWSGGVWMLHLLALLSGACALAYEILYMRALTTLFGDIFYVHAALLSTFLLGVGIGARVAHRWVRWLFLIELLTGLYAFWFSPLSRWLSGSPALTWVASRPSLTILGTIGLLLLPSLLIGFTLPLFSAYVKLRRREQLSFQGIYQVYNLGALLGIVLVEFFLVRTLGVSASFLTVGSLNFLTGLALIPFRPAEPRSAPAPPIQPEAGLQVSLFLASFGSAAFQMFFLKLIYLVFHPHRENFSIALLIILGGIFTGAWMASRWPFRFATLLLAVPVLWGAIYGLYLPLLRLYQATAVQVIGSDLLILAHKLGFAALFALLPMLFLGGLLPALMRAEGRVEEESGRLLWISSLGNAAGYLFFVLWGHPVLGNRLLMGGLAGLMWLAALLALRGRPVRSQWALITAGVVAMTGALVLWEDRNFYLAQWVRELSPGDQVTIFKSGAESATLLSTQDYEWVSYNGHPSVYVQQNGVFNRAETLSGLVPALGAPRLDRALILGMGTGITAGTAARIFHETDVVEINQAFFKMLPHLDEASLGLRKNPAARLHLADGRAFLIGKESVYDAVVNSIPSPTYFSASKIYTVEFFGRVRRSLKPDGVFSSWLSAPNMSEPGLLTLLATLRSQFRHCDLKLLRQSYYLTTCSQEPIRNRSFSELGIEGPLLSRLQSAFPGFDLDQYFEDIRLSPNLFEELPAGLAPINRDDYPILEFMAVRAAQTGRIGRDPFFEEQGRFNIDPVGPEGRTDPERLARKARVYQFAGRGFFDLNFLPFLRSRPENWEAWMRLQGELGGGR